MARKILFTLMLVASIFFVAKAEDRPIGFEQLPQPAKDFVRKHFNEADVILVTIDKEFLSTTYDVKLQNGVSIDFDKTGKWKDIDGGHVALPESVIPGKIASFVSGKHAGAKIVKISRDRRHYEVELNNDLDLIFDLKTMAFKRYDN